jgi:large subunit ribosomal protein L6
MSRIGKNKIEIPPGVEILMGEDNLIIVKGPKGALSRRLHPKMILQKDQTSIAVERPDDERENRMLHGLTRTLIFNMIEGVSKGYTKDLEIVGVGFKAEKKGRNLMLTLGYSHPIVFVPPEGIDIEVKAPLEFSVAGIDKELVGECAAKIRSFKKPEPYKGKGIRYKGEYVPRKAGKYAK